MPDIVSVHISALSQLTVFIAGIILGFIFGLFYEFFRFPRIFINMHWAFVFIEDMLYSFICSVCTVLFAFIFNKGQLRIYIILAVGFGIVLYCISVGILMRRLSVLIYRKIKNKTGKI